MEEIVPRRVVLRVDEQYELEWANIVETYLASIDVDTHNDFYAHLMAPNMSTKMHIVLDIPSKLPPSVDPSSIAYKVYRVKRADELCVDNLLWMATIDPCLVSSSNSTKVLVDSLANAVQTCR
ncbi:hypothetical protein PMZ80_007127 [Knufia obscura]|uniref:Uncharacterized protein n=1 Tax=Knufia obscura TaxID=1635080 RepID=A0ABR0RJF4_9EURO|nr:hypothetical protein PMZ80_007127 [Knufia obscura]